MDSFWNGYNLDNFLLQGVNVSSVEGFSGVFIAIMTAALVYEGVKTFRDLLMDRFLEKRRSAKNKNAVIYDANNCKPNPSPVHYTKSSETKDEPGSEINKSSGGTEGSIEIKSTNCSKPVPEPRQSPYSLYNRKQMKRLAELSVSTLLHMIHVCLGYTLMLAVMTFNVWVLAAVAIGTGGGFFIFDVLKRKML